MMNAHHMNKPPMPTQNYIQNSVLNPIFNDISTTHVQNLHTVKNNNQNLPTVNDLGSSNMSISDVHTTKNTHNDCDKNTNELVVPNLLVLSHANLHNKKECAYDMSQFAQHILEHYHLNEADT